MDFKVRNFNPTHTHTHIPNTHTLYSHSNSSRLVKFKDTGHTASKKEYINVSAEELKVKYTCKGTEGISFLLY